MSDKKDNPFLDALKDMIQKAKEDRPKGAVPYGTIVRSARYPKTWGVVYDAVIRNKDMNGNPIISYSVSWCQEDPKSNSRGPLFGPTPLVTVEAEYDLIYILFPPKQKRNAWLKCIQMVTVFTLLVGILLALLLPGGTLMLIVWLRSKHAEKQRELLKKINNKRKLTLKKLQREQFRYMRSKKK